MADLYFVNNSRQIPKEMKSWCLPVKRACMHLFKLQWMEQGCYKSAFNCDIVILRKGLTPRAALKNINIFYNNLKNI